MAMLTKTYFLINISSHFKYIRRVKFFSQSHAG